MAPNDAAIRVGQPRNNRLADANWHPAYLTHPAGVIRLRGFALALRNIHIPFAMRVPVPFEGVTQAVLGYECRTAFGEACHYELDG
jgi:hypothetical protein